MSWNRWSFVFLAGVLALGFAVLYGQQPTSVGAPQERDTILRPDTPLEVCHITVQDKSGHLVTNLKQSAFTLLENGVKQEIQVFSHEDSAVSMGLIIDKSGSMRGKRSSVEAAALVLVKDSHPDDEVFVVNFNDKIYFDNPHGKDFTTDREEVQEALTRVDSHGDTAIWEAILKSIEWMRRAHKGTHVLAVVTDGGDNASHVKLDELMRSAQQSEVVIYVIGLLADEDKSTARDARRQLTSLAEATGGEAFYPHQLRDVDRIAHQVARDIRSQYLIGYKPSNEALDGAFRKIKVTVKAAGNPTARTRTGYYATTNQASSPAPHSNYK